MREGSCNVTAEEGNGMRVLFEPVQNTTSGATLGFRCVLGGNDDLSRISLKDAFPLQKPIDAVATANNRLTQAAAETLRDLEAAGRHERVIVPVSARALAGVDAATKTLAPLKSLTSPQKQHLIVEMFDLPQRLSLDALEDATIPLLSYAHGFIGHPPVGLHDCTVFANCNYLGLMVTLRGDEDDEFELRSTWAEGQKRRLKLVVGGIASPEILALAKKYEAFGISGPTVAPLRISI